MVNLTGRKKSSEIPKIAVINEIEKNGLKNAVVVKTKPKKKKEILNETEMLFLEKMFTAYLKQYPLISKGKNPDKYKANHKMGKSVGKKLVRMNVLPKPDEKDKYV